MAGNNNTAGSLELCAVCGKALPLNAPAGLCPVCLLGRGVALATRSGVRPGDFIPPAPDELAVLFPEFEIVSLIGRGGMGAVYKAVQPELDRTVAIKLLPPETARDAEFMERFRREATTLARLDHPGIVRLFDYGQRDDFAYFVMEFVDGVDLSQRMADGPMSSVEALGVVDQLCDALQHLHERGVIHRDIKPANILIRQDGRVKLADFGLARLLQPELGDLGLTRTHARLGTPRYMAPEQMIGSKCTDHRVDIYALGVVLYEMLTGYLPVGHFDAPSEKVASLAPRLDAVVLQALHAEPEKRFASVGEIKHRLRDAIERPGLTRSERRRQIASRAFVSSLIAAAIGAGAVVLWSSKNAGPDPVAISAPTILVNDTLPSGRLVVLGAPCPFDGQPVFAVSVSGSQNEFGVVLRPDGVVAAWGDNRFGQTDVPAGLRGVIAIAAGQGTKSAHALALREDGTVVGWGDNTFKQATAPDGLSNVVSIAAGEFHSLALTSDGRLIAWGKPGSSAIAVPSEMPPAKAIAAGADFSVALLMNGTPVAWGLDDAGQCQVPELSVGVVEIAAGARHAVARLEDGRVIAWGDNSEKQCHVPQGLNGVTAVYAGGDGSAAVDSDGQLHAWGKVRSRVRTLTGVTKRVSIGSTTWAVVVSNGEVEH